METEQVQDAIYAAFAELPVPHPRAILRPVDSQNRSSAEEFQRELAGKSWQCLTPAFLAERWSAFCYLSPEAYRYYLPSLLTGALRAFSDDSALMHSVVFDLRPSFWSLYYEGEDRDMRARQSAFTAPQYRAVCLFLGLVFDRLPHLRHLAAQALHWGWNQRDTPALEAVNKYYHELRSFSYPEPEDPQMAALCQEIYAAFATTPYPGDNELCGSEQGDEPAENAMELRGLKWQSAHPALLARCHTALSFLSDSGFRYFLPAFLLADLLGSELGYESNANPVFSLTHGLYDPGRDQVDLNAFSTLYTESRYLNEIGISREEVREMIRRHNEQQKECDWQGYRIRRLKSFDHRERIAIIHYLEYRAQDEYEATEINEALERYWRH